MAKKTNPDAIGTEVPPEMVDLVPVRVVRQDGARIVVSWVEGGREYRAWLPASLGSFDAVNRAALVQADSYGVPWARIAPPCLYSPERLEAALHGAGIWTLDDLQRNPAAASGALQAALGIDLGGLLTAAAAQPANKEA